MPAPFCFDRTWEFDVPPAEVWAGITRTEEFPEWWAWLRELDADGIYEGAVARCVIQPPLPYSLRLEVHLGHVEEPRFVAATVRGDLDGPARVEVSPTPTGSALRMSFELELRDPVLRGLSVLGRPMMVWAHDRVCDIGVRQFRRRALDDLSPRRSAP